MFTNPFITVWRVQETLGVTNQGARNLVKEAARRGWLNEIGPIGRGGRVYWVAQDLYNVIEDRSSY